MKEDRKEEDYYNILSSFSVIFLSPLDELDDFVEKPRFTPLTPNPNICPIYQATVGAGL